MSRKDKLLLKLLAGRADANFDLDDRVNLLRQLHFQERQSGGSHHVFWMEGISGIINLQKTKDGKAKSYQVKQVRTFLVDHKIIDADEQV